ncbi:MAG: peptidylprolyl isomerase [Planctomycetota bacterium]
MKKYLPILLILLASLGVTIAVAQQDQAPENPAPAQPDAPEAAAPAEPDFDPNEVLAKVGEKKITRGELEKLMDQFRVPPAQRQAVMGRAIDGMIAETLNDLFMKQMNIEVKQEDIDKIKQALAAQAQQYGMTVEQAMAMQGMTEDDLKEQARIGKLIETVTAEEKVDAYVKDHPGYFDGSGVTAKLLFLPSAFTDPTAKQKAAVERMEKIARQVRKDETTFAKQAEADKELDLQSLDRVTFTEVTPLIGTVAFDLKAGQVSKPVRFPNGVAIIKLEEKVDAETVAERLAEDRKKELAEKAKMLLSRTGDEPSDEDVQKLLAEHPEYIDGTTVTASHILLTQEEDATEEQVAEAKKKLEEIAKKISAGEITFAEAAKAHSGCPSSAKGGDLGQFTYERMVGPFSKVAFASKVGEVSGPVRTQFGWHLIKVTDRTEPARPGEMTAEETRESAREALMAQLQKKLFQLPKDHPIEIYYEAPEPVEEPVAPEVPEAPEALESPAESTEPEAPAESPEAGQDAE